MNEPARATGAAGHWPWALSLPFIYASAAAAFMAFAVWGSFFPFTFRSVDAGAALASFWAARLGGPLAWSWSDVAANVLLFIPIGFFGAAALDVPALDRGRWSPWCVVFGAGVLLSFTIEAGQAFVPWRVSSVVDVLAESCGTAIGIRGRVIARGPCDRFVASWSAWVEQASPAQRVLLVYCAGFAIAWLLPLDLTLRPGEIADKYFHKRLLLPLTPSPDAASARELAGAFVAAIPLGVAAAWRDPAGTVRRSLAGALAVAIPAVCILHTMQIFVFSRTTDGTMLLPVSGGILAGALFARH